MADRVWIFEHSCQLFDPKRHSMRKGCDKEKEKREKKCEKAVHSTNVVDGRLQC